MNPRATEQGAPRLHRGNASKARRSVKVYELAMSGDSA